MAFVGKPKDEQQYGRLMGMIAPEATPSKRVGTEAPIGAVTAGPSAGKSAADFTKVSAASPGSVFQRQLGSADIGGVTRLAEQPLLREAESEALRVAKEGQQYRDIQAQARSQAPQFQYTGKKDGKDVDYTSDIIGKIAGGQGEYGTAEKIMAGKPIETPELSIGDIKEFTPLQALRGGSVESLLKKEAQGPYSTGMAGLDALLFAKKGGAGQLQQRGQALQATEQAAADALEKAATAEERKKAEELASGQKSQLEKALKGGVTAREEKYTKAPEGGQSKLQQAQGTLGQQYAEAYGKTAQERQQFINQQIEATKAKALEDTIAALRRESIAQQESAGRNVQGDVTIKIPTRSELLAAAQNDPRYQHAVRTIDLQSPYAQQRGALQAGNVPTLGLQNVITPEDAEQYNRLQQLLSGQAIKPTSATFTPGSYNKQDIENFFRNLMGQTTI